MARDGVGADIWPRLGLFSGDRVDWLLLPGDRDETLDVIPKVIAGVQPDAVAMLSEGYAAKGRLAKMAFTAPENFQPGALAQAYADGDESVAECVLIATLATLAMTDDTPGYCVEMPYRYMPGQGVVWGDSKEMVAREIGDGPPGAVLTALRRGRAVAADWGREWPPFPAYLVARTLGLTPANTDPDVAIRLGMQDLRPPAPGRNAPCTCGSGHKSKLCCWR